MEKGFNDDELADIMNEIESLEQEFTDDEQTESVESETEQIVAKQEESQQSVQEVQHEQPVQEVQPEQPVQEVQHEQPVQKVQHERPVQVESQMDEVLENLSEMAVEDVVPEKNIKSYDDNIHHMKQQGQVEQSWSSPKKSNPAHTSMNFKIEGEMKLDLSFCIGGQDVQLHVSDEGFEIELAGGAKFSLPVNNLVKKVA
jgi:hypothetical protein